MIVVDTNVLAYLYISGDHSALAEQIYLIDPDWVAPILWQSELRNVLATYMRQSLLDLQSATAIMTEAEALMTSRSHNVSSEQVLRLAKQSSCSAYDCEFVALASQLDVPLITSDKKLLDRFATTAIAPQAFIALHQPPSPR